VLQSIQCCSILCLLVSKNVILLQKCTGLQDPQGVWVFSGNQLKVIQELNELWTEKLRRKTTSCKIQSGMNLERFGEKKKIYCYL